MGLRSAMNGYRVARRMPGPQEIKNTLSDMKLGGLKVYSVRLPMIAQVMETNKEFLLSNEGLPRVVL